MTQLKRFITPTALLAALTFAASPSFAQEKYHGRRDGQPQPAAGAPARQEGRAQPRSEAPQAQPRQEAQPQRPAEQPRAQQPQQQQQRQAEPPPRAQSRDEGRRDPGRADNRRVDDNRGNGDNRRYDSGRAVPRGNVYAPRYEPRYSPRYSPRGYGYAPRGYGYYGSRSYQRPYVFRPRYSIGFGLFAGFPVPYTYSYPYPIEVYGYRAPRERVMITPNSPYYGGVALEMSPYDADVFVDGTYAGRVEDFDGSEQPLTLTVGVHEIEVQAQGYEPMRVNVEVRPGQIIPYRGDLRPY